MIHYHTDLFFRAHAPAMSKVVALGDDMMNLEFSQGVKAVDYYKQFDITSVDWNGYATVNADLSKLVKNPDLANFDVVTDFGTGEHVQSLYYFLRNAFNFISSEGIGIHANPKTGHFPGHQLPGQKHPSHHFTTDFWTAYTKAAKLELLAVSEQAAYGNTETGVEIYAAYRKTAKSKFPTKKKFDEIAGKYVFPK